MIADVVRDLLHAIPVSWRWMLFTWGIGLITGAVVGVFAGAWIVILFWLASQ